MTFISTSNNKIYLPEIGCDLINPFLLSINILQEMKKYTYRDQFMTTKVSVKLFYPLFIPKVNMNFLIKVPFQTNSLLSQALYTVAFIT